MCYLKENKKNIRFLIINADDFGLAKDINRGIIRSFKEGVVTSASLLSVGGYFNDAVRLAKENPELDIGIHLCLTEEKPILGKEAVPSLVNKRGCFLRPRLNFIFNYASGRISHVDIENELEAQIKKVLENGLSPTHIDSHNYVHMLPGILTVVIRLAKKYNIKIIRYPREKISFYNFRWQRYAQFGFLALFCLLSKFNQQYRGFIRTDYFFGFLDSGQLSAESIRRSLANFDFGIAELTCHPGEHQAGSEAYRHWDYDWQGELKALTSDRVKKSIEGSGIKLVSFKGIA